MTPTPEECKICGLRKTTVDDLAPFGPTCVNNGKHDFGEQKCQVSGQEKKIPGTKNSVCNDCLDNGFKGAPCPHIEVSGKNSWKKEYTELAHAYFEPGNKDYWDGIEFAESFIEHLVSEVESQARTEEQARIVKILEGMDRDKPREFGNGFNYALDEAIKSISDLKNTPQ